MNKGPITSAWLTAPRVPFFATLLACAASLVLGVPASAAPINVTSYAINDAVLSGHGNWAHVYTGTITPSGVTFINGGFQGATGTYTGGGGTLNDGVIGNSLVDTQLFVAGQTSISPRLLLMLDATSASAWYVDRVELYGGNIDNAIPGALTGVSLGIVGPGGSTAGMAFSTIPFGSGAPLVNDLLDLAGTDLAKMAAQAVVLSDFQGTFMNWFSITEIRVYGTSVGDPVPIPLPGTLWLVAAAVLALRIGRPGALRGGDRR